MMLTDVQRAARAQAICEQRIWTGPRRGEPCRWRAKWKRRQATVIDGGLRVCGVHARGFTPASLVLIGAPGWVTE